MNKKRIALVMAVLAILSLMSGCKVQQGNPVSPTEKAPAETNSPADFEQTQPAEGETTDATVAPDATISPEETTEPDASNPTIPAENVQMGTVKGEEDEGITDDDVTATTPTQGKDPEETTPPTETTNPDDNVLGEDFDITELTYESYKSMTGEQQKAVIDMFASPEEFLRWYNKAEEKYKQEHPDIEIGADGNANAGNP